MRAERWHWPGRGAQREKEQKKRRCTRPVLVLTHPPLTLAPLFISLDATPAEVAPVDWEHYRKAIKTPGIVDAVQKKVRQQRHVRHRVLRSLRGAPCHARCHAVTL